VKRGRSPFSRLLFSVDKKDRIHFNVLMRRLLMSWATVALFACLDGCSTIPKLSSPAISEPPPPSISPEQQAFVAEAKPGITRSELEKHFYLNASMFGELEQPYALYHEDLDGTVIKIKVDFRPKDMSAEVFNDPMRRQKWWSEHLQYGFPRPDDIIMNVSKPYREVPNTSID
jgi:hypothetical protein